MLMVAALSEIQRGTRRLQLRLHSNLWRQTSRKLKVNFKSRFRRLRICTKFAYSIRNPSLKKKKMRTWKPKQCPIFIIFYLRNSRIRNERISATGSTGSPLRQAGFINCALLVLGHCVNAIRNIPYRESQLTRLLSPFLARKEAFLSILACINSHQYNQSELLYLPSFKYSSVHMNMGVICMYAKTCDQWTP